ncbi:MAG: aminotransferase class IV [bacterium]|nr:aminotransferase class IV [bacterium]
MTTVFLNGSFIPRHDARISAFDAAFQHGVGLFETMLAVADSADEPRVIHLQEHLSRLATSAETLGLASSINIDALAEAVQMSIRRAAAESRETIRFRLRLTITGGDLNLLEAARAAGQTPGAQQPTILIVAQPATKYPDEIFSRGTMVVLADLKLNPLDPFQGHKTVNYWARLRELQQAAAKRAGEALVLQVSNHLAGGCVSNILLVKDEEVYTPICRGEEEEVAEGVDGDGIDALGDSPSSAVMPSPVLPGVVRGWALDTLKDEGVKPERRLLGLQDVLDADEVLLTNSSWGVMPVVQLESKTIGDGAVGPITRMLVERWRDVVASKG